MPLTDIWFRHRKNGYFLQIFEDAQKEQNSEQFLRNAGKVDLIQLNVHLAQTRLPYMSNTHAMQLPPIMRLRFSSMWPPLSQGCHWLDSPLTLPYPHSKCLVTVNPPSLQGLVLSPRSGHFQVDPLEAGARYRGVDLLDVVDVST